ncbi:GNAT family N-acetyltransferase [Saccharospirillum mangrovi]|uniref:GNAT family N-acetyltransferase n=1 Tax=Saccharospirillum mangrovi TaxID=2161747 RepID=UPI000D33810D|nr:GNAT family N-acetyltransferase [Saccharospirillum mangrovi]
MLVQYRKAQSADVDRLFFIRANTRDNPIPTEQLEPMGITPTSIRQGFEQEQLCGWVCLAGDVIVGFCNGDLNTGEVLVLALLPEFEGQGIGRQLLGHVVTELKQQGVNTIWLAADSNSEVRAHGFYRKLGWVPTGERLENGDEILILQS